MSKKSTIKQPLIFSLLREIDEKYIKCLKIIPYDCSLEKSSNENSFSHKFFDVHLSSFILCSFGKEMRLFTNSIDIQLLENKKEFFDLESTSYPNAIYDYIKSIKAINIVILSDFIYYNNYLNIEKSINKKITSISIDSTSFKHNANFKDEAKDKQQIILMDKSFFGLSWIQKMKNLKNTILKMDKNLDYFIIESFESASWNLNIRSKNYEISPFVKVKLLIDCKNNFSYILVDSSDLQLIKKCFEKEECSDIAFISEGDFFSFIKNNFTKEKIVGMDYSSSSLFLVSKLSSICNAKIKNLEDPTRKTKAIKNITELNNFKEIHAIDSARIIEFLEYFSKNIGKITEIDCENYILQLRKKSDLFICNSFETISGFKENSAKIHYKATPFSNKLIEGNGVYLIDSGGHYFGGTTDITRTICIGNENDYCKECYTLVLKGLIAMQSSIFSPTTKFSYLDKLARSFLLEKNLNYPHGTSHGIGNCLNVHENSPEFKLDLPLKEGLIISAEPGIYFDKNFGIRIENNLFVKKTSKDQIKFEILNFVPYDKKMIKESMLSESEKSHLSEYSRQIIVKTSKYLSPNTINWLREGLLYL